MKTNTKRINTWNKEEKWPALVGYTAKAMCLNHEEKKRLSRSLAAEVVTATAFISGCKDPERVALAHLTTFMTAVRCPEIFAHKKGETISDRLQLGNYYPGGDQEAVRACMLILEMISLNDHKQDFKNDLINGKFNPLAFDLNYDKARVKIEKEFKNLSPSVKDSMSNLFTNSILLDGGMWW